MKKKNKSGVILVTVLFILALSMILISCALLLTTATRTRVYEKAEKAQARLTVTSVAESFQQALQMQEITDKALEQYANGNSTVTIEMENGIPGMKTTTDNKTTAHIYNTTIEGENYTCIDFTTTVGAATENVRMFLSQSEGVDPPDLFSSQIDFNGDMDNNFRGAIGAGAPSNAPDNLIVFRGNYHSNQSQGTVIDSDVLFLGKSNQNNNAYFENNEIFNGDLIFLDKYYLSFNSTAVTINGDVYFIGAGGQDKAFVGNDSANRTYGKSSSTWTFVNRSTNVSQTASNVFSAINNTKNTLFISAPANNKWKADLSSALSGVGGYSSKMTTWQNSYNNGTSNNKVNKAKKYFTTDTSSLVQYYPTTQQMKDEYGMPISVSDCGSYEIKSFADLIGTAGVLPAKNYLIQGDTSWVGHQITSGSKPYVVVLDGQKDYIFFINESVTLEGVVFAVLNPSSAHHQYFILAPNKNITLNCVNSGDTGKVACGFLSIGRGYTSASDYVTAIGNMNMSNCDSYYNGVAKPTINFYAMGNNKIDIIRGTVFEGYLGQFEGNYDGGSNSKISFINANGANSFKFYGRIMATNIISTSADFKMPYCPSPKSTHVEEFTEVGSKYSIVGFQYYY